jgi:hypothetical protein
MALVVAPEEVQAWLEQSKLTVTEVDQSLHEAARALVFSRVAEVYDTETWVDVSTTPDLIRKVASLYIAAWVYNRAFSSLADVGTTYGDKLIAMADTLCAAIIGGDASLLDVPAAELRDTMPDFWPDESTGAVQQYDAVGNAIGDSRNSEDIKFTMGMRF